MPRRTTMPHECGRMERPAMRAPRTRLEAVVKKVQDCIPVLGSDAALEAVKWLIGPSIALAQVARDAGMDRSDLHVLLTVNKGRILHAKRRALERVLNLPPGGMAMVLAPVEDHRQGDA